MTTMGTMTEMILITNRKTKKMKIKGTIKNLASPPVDDNQIDPLRGYPIYPAGEDVYSKFKEEQDIDPSDISMIKVLNVDEKAGSNLVKVVKENISGNDLDVPGSELDDKMEDIGSEDEENNYYSIGGDDHENLDEDKGE